MPNQAWTSRLLLVEDEEHIANGLKFNLKIEGYEIWHAKDGLQAQQWLFDQKEHFDLIILDVMLPGLTGFDLCHALRKSHDYTPILMLTAKDFQKDKIMGLRLGADDYVTKPFDLEELLTRIQSLLRRQQVYGRSLADTLLFGQACVDFDCFTATVNTKTIKLTHLEFKLLKVLAEHEGRVLSREDLLEKVWDIVDQGSLRTVDNFILRLRKVFEPDPKHPKHFHSIRGVGYKFTMQEKV